VLQSFRAAGFEDLDVVVVDRFRLRRRFLWGHGLQQMAVLNSTRPLLPQFGGLFAQVGDQLRQELFLVFSVGSRERGGALHI
jgi:hypothetical protein